MEETASRTKWAKYYENQKKIWYNTNTSIYVKAILRIVELHRSDSKGWSLSIRKIAGLLGITTNTTLKYVNEAINSGLLESSGNHQRKRRKLRLSVSLRAPVEFETSDQQKLSHWNNQPVSPNETTPVVPVEPVNKKEISKKNNPSSSKKEFVPTYSLKKFEEYRRFVDEHIRGRRSKG